MRNRFHPPLPPGYNMMILNGTTSIRGPGGWLLRFPSNTSIADASRRYRTFLILNGITDEQFMSSSVTRIPYIIEIGGRQAEPFSLRRDHYTAN